jgi:mannan endo-1,4-beta-mannosidase
MEKRFIKITALLLALLSALMAGCGGGNGGVITDGFIAVEGITLVDEGPAVAGEGFTLSGDVTPSTATNKTIVWTVKSAGDTGAAITGSTLTAAAVGTVTVTATITNGASATTNYTKDFNITVVPVGTFIAVQDITLADKGPAVAGEGFTLSGDVTPSTATNKTIVWTVNADGGTGAAITGDTLTAAAAGTVTVTATITNGASATTNYTKEFTITVEATNALETSFNIVTNGGSGNLIMGNSLAWIKDAKEGSVVVFYMSTTVYPDSSAETFKPKAGETIAVIGNSSDNSIEVKIPAGTSPGAGRAIRLEIPLEQALALIGDATFLKVDILYGRINACDLMEPRRYKVPHSPNAQRLMNYFRDIYGEKMVSGMMDQSWEDSTDARNQVMIVKNATGKFPALKGFDNIQHLVTSGSLTIRQQAEEALYWWKGYDRQQDGSAFQWVKLFPDRDDVHGIVCYCWHWRGTDGRDGSSGANPSFYATADAAGQGQPTTLKVPLEKMDNGKFKLNKAHPNFAYIKGEIDKVIAEFKWISEQAGEDVPIIWRPLHEAGGNWGRGAWFWWGVPGTEPVTEQSSSGADAFKALWEYMYDYMTIVNGLDNLIWLCNPQGDIMNTWVPDLKTVDLTGYDPYVGDNTSQKYYYDNTKKMDPTGNTMVAMSENGRIPDPDLCIQDDALWLFFMIWNGMAASSGGTQGISYYYNHERVVTLDSLPDLTKYRLK